MKAIQENIKCTIQQLVALPTLKNLYETNVLVFELYWLDTIEKLKENVLSILNHVEYLNAYLDVHSKSICLYKRTDLGWSSQTLTIPLEAEEGVGLRICIEMPQTNRYLLRIAYSPLFIDFLSIVELLRYILALDQNHRNGLQHYASYIDYAYWQAESISNDSQKKVARIPDACHHLKQLDLLWKYAGKKLVKSDIEIDAESLGNVEDQSFECLLLYILFSVTQSLMKLKQMILAWWSNGRHCNELDGSIGSYGFWREFTLERIDVSQLRNMLALTSIIEEELSSAEPVFATDISFSYFDLRSKLPHSMRVFSESLQFPGAIHFQVIRNRESVLMECYSLSETASFKTLELLLSHVKSKWTKPTSNLSDFDQSIITKCRNFVKKEVPSVLEKFKHNVYMSPDKIAVICKDRTLTYQMLDSLSTHLAMALLKVTQSGAVGIHLKRSEWIVVSILAIWKANAYYVPLDIKWPPSKVNETIAMTNVSYVITEDFIHALNLSMVDDSLLIPLAGTLDAYAYVLSTSGTTGHPKAVPIKHSSLAQLCDSLETTIYSYHKYIDTVTINGPFTFDTSIKQIITGLSGRTLWILTDEERYDLENLQKGVLKHREISIDVTPTQMRYWMANGLLEYIVPGSIFLLGGEAIDEMLWEKLLHDKRHMYYNLYGPTECCVDVTCCKIDEGHARLGLKLPHVGVEIWDTQALHAPIGELGELVIGGLGVSEGYLDGANNGFFKRGELIYFKSGDFGYLDVNGEIGFVGRRDRQVKIRGHRVNLNEIERIARALTCVENAHAIFKSDKLILFLQTKNSDISLFWKYISDRTPLYLRPHSLILMHAFPRDEHGKIDLRKLLQHAEEQVQSKRIPSEIFEGEVAIAYRQAWQEVLGRQDFDLQTNFFELGGDSIKCIQIAAILKKKGYLIPIMKMFTLYTIADLITVTTKAIQIKKDIKGIVDCKKTQILPIQRRFFERTIKDRDRWNQSVLIKFKKNVSFSHLSNCLLEIQNRYPVLASRFYEIAADDWQQESLANAFMPAFEEFYVASRQELEKVLESVQGKMSIQDGITWAAAMVTLDEERYLYWVIHHLVVDEESWKILLNDLDSLVAEASVPLQKPAFSYFEWANILHKNLSNSPNLLKQFDLNGCTPLSVEKQVLSQSITKTGSQRCTFNWYFNEAISKQIISGLNYAKGIRPECLLIAALFDAISQDKKGKFYIDRETTGRVNPYVMEYNAQDVVGWLTAVIPLVVQLSDDPITLLRNTKQALYLTQENEIQLFYAISQKTRQDAYPLINQSRLLFTYFDVPANERVDYSHFSYASGFTLPEERSHELSMKYSLEIDAYFTRGSLLFLCEYDGTRIQEKQLSEMCVKLERSLIKLLDTLNSNTGDVLIAYGIHKDFSSNEAIKKLEEQYGGLQQIYSVGLIQRDWLEVEKKSDVPVDLLFHVTLDFKKSLVDSMLEDEISKLFIEIPYFRSKLVPYYENGQQYWINIVLAQPKAFYTQRISPAADISHRTIRISGDLDLQFQHIVKEDHSRLIITFSLKSFDLVSIFFLIDCLLKRVSIEESGRERLQYRSSTRMYHTADKLLSSAELNVFRDYLSSSLSRVSNKVQRRFIGKEGHAQTFYLEDKKAQIMHDLSKRHSVSLNILLLSLWNLILYKESSNAGCLHGITVSGRSLAETNGEEQLGRLVNVLPFDGYFSVQETFTNYLHRMSFAYYSMLQFDWVPLFEIEKEIKQEIEFRTNFVFESIPIDQAYVEKFGLRAIPECDGILFAPEKIEVAPLENGCIRIRHSIAEGLQHIQSDDRYKSWHMLTDALQKVTETSPLQELIQEIML